MHLAAAAVGGVQAGRPAHARQMQGLQGGGVHTRGGTLSRGARRPAWENQRQYSNQQEAGRQRRQWGQCRGAERGGRNQAFIVMRAGSFLGQGDGAERKSKRATARAASPGAVQKRRDSAAGLNKNWPQGRCGEGGQRRGQHEGRGQAMKGRRCPGNGGRRGGESGGRASSAAAPRKQGGSLDDGAGLDGGVAQNHHNAAAGGRRGQAGRAALSAGRGPGGQRWARPAPTQPSPAPPSTHLRMKKPSSSRAASCTPSLHGVEAATGARVSAGWEHRRAAAAGWQPTSRAANARSGRSGGGAWLGRQLTC